MLHAAHLHHGLRGAEADGDLEFCRELAAKLEIPFHEARVDTAQEARADANRQTGREHRGGCAAAALFLFEQLMSKELSMLLLQRIRSMIRRKRSGQVFAWRVDEGLSRNQSISRDPEGGDFLRPLLRHKDVALKLFECSLGQAGGKTPPIAI